MRERTKWVAGALHWLLAGFGAILLLGMAVALALAFMSWLSPDFQAQMVRESIADGVTPDIRARVADGSLFAMIAAALLLAALLIWMLWRIVGRVRRGDPFAAANPRDIYCIAGLLALLEMGSWLVQVIFPLASKCGRENSSFDPSGLLGILIAVVLAEVFREGNRLRDDVAGTV
jgi:hypothetical protein